MGTLRKAIDACLRHDKDGAPSKVRRQRQGDYSCSGCSFGVCMLLSLLSRAVVFGLRSMSSESQAYQRMTTMNIWMDEREEKKKGNHTTAEEISN